MSSFPATETTEQKKIVVVGAGAFGTSLATVAARNSHDVVLLARDSRVVDSINTSHKNPKYLTEFELLPNVRATTDVIEALTDADLIILSLPTQTVTT